MTPPRRGARSALPLAALSALRAQGLLPTLCAGVVTSGLRTYKEGLLTCGPGGYGGF